MGLIADRLAAPAAQFRATLNSVIERVPGLDEGHGALAAKLRAAEAALPRPSKLVAAQCLAAALMVGALVPDGHADDHGWRGNISSQRVYDVVEKTITTCERLRPGAQQHAAPQPAPEAAPQRRGIGGLIKDLAPIAVGAAIGAKAGGEGGTALGALGGGIFSSVMRGRAEQRGVEDIPNLPQAAVRQGQPEEVCRTSAVVEADQHVGNRLYLDIEGEVYAFDVPLGWRPGDSLMRSDVLAYDPQALRAVESRPAEPQVVAHRAAEPRAHTIRHSTRSPGG